MPPSHCVRLCADPTYLDPASTTVRVVSPVVGAVPVARRLVGFQAEALPILAVLPAVQARIPTRTTVLGVSVQLQAEPVAVRLPRRTSRLSLLWKGDGLNPSDLEQLGPAGVRRRTKQDDAEERTEGAHYVRQLKAGKAFPVEARGCWT